MAILIKEQCNTYNEQFLDLRNDYVFKSFFGDKRNTHFLLSFLNSILDEAIHSIQLVDPHIETTHSADKKSVMDIRVETIKGEQINLEMQMEGHGGFKERMYMYMAKMYVSQDRVAKEYTDYQRAIQIVVTDFKLLEEKQFHNVYKITNQKSGSIFTKHFETHVLELPKLKNENRTNATKLEKWLLFIKGDQKTKEELSMESSTMKQAFEEIERLSQDPETRRLAEFRAQELKDIRQREREAREEGIEHGKSDIVIRMYRENFSTEDIIRITGVPLDRINEIINKLEQ